MDTPLIEFLKEEAVVANIIGGIVVALLLATVALFGKVRNRIILNQLAMIRGRAIVHRNSGERAAYTDEKDWIEQAKVIEEEAIRKAKLLSPRAGSLVEWLDRVPPRKDPSEVQRYVSILSTVAERIQGILERNS